MQMLEFIEELAKKICEIELCVSNLSASFCKFQKFHTLGLTKIIKKVKKISL